MWWETQCPARVSTLLLTPRPPLCALRVLHAGHRPTRTIVATSTQMTARGISWPLGAALCPCLALCPSPPGFLIRGRSHLPSRGVCDNGPFTSPVSGSAPSSLCHGLPPAACRATSRPTAATGRLPRGAGPPHALSSRGSRQAPAAPVCSPLRRCAPAGIPGGRGSEEQSPEREPASQRRLWEEGDARPARPGSRQTPVCGGHRAANVGSRTQSNTDFSCGAAGAWRGAG